VAEDSDLAGGAGAVALEDLDRRGLAGTIGAEEREGLAALDREGDVVHGTFAGGVLLAEVLDLDGGGLGHGSSFAARWPWGIDRGGGLGIVRSGDGAGGGGGSVSGR